jgi:magnesium-protoporphyrin O-methyltransferase
MKILWIISLGYLTQGFVPSCKYPSRNVPLWAVDDKVEVREYFNNEGFNRWNKIYSDSDDVNSVQLDIRNGHDQTIQKILNWAKADGDMSGKTVCDCGCGVGSLAIPLAQMGMSDRVENLSSIPHRILKSFC